MPFATKELNENKMSLDEKKRLLLVVSEMKARGIPIPEGFELPQTKSDPNWGLGENGYFVKSDGTVFNPRQELVDFIKDDSHFILLKSGRGGGKALWIETPILTYNNGWTTMGSLRVGDTVFSTDGVPVKVNFASNVMYRHRTYNVVFSDGSYLVADGEHLWTVLEKSSHNKTKFVTITTEEILEAGLVNAKKVYRFAVPLANPIQYMAKELEMPPYVLGAWLGDGSSRDSIITISPKDLEMTDHLKFFGWEVHNVTDKYTWSFSYKGKGHTRFSEIMHSLGVWKNKHIPRRYLESSVGQRIQLLQGLMDTDGTISTSGHCSFDNKNYQLALDVRELLTGLGIKSTINRYEILDYNTPTWSYKVAFTANIAFPVFRLSRKLSRQKSVTRSDIGVRAIVDIQPCESVPVRCIEVAAQNHLYLAGKDLIPTHNTTAGAQKVMFKIMSGESGAVMSPDFENFRVSTWPELRDWIPWNKVVPKHRYRQSNSWEPIRPFSIVFTNGAILYCKGLKDPESARGSNVNFFWYDEGRRDPTGLGWKNAIAFCRVGNMPQAWCTTTPAGTDHWTTKFFESEPTEELKAVVADLRARGINQKLFSIYKTSTKANSENLAPGYYASLLSAYPSGYLRARELDGEAADEGGSLGDRGWFNGKELPAYPEWGTKFVRFWDLAATERKILAGKKINDPDEAVGTLLCTDSIHKLELKKYAICDQMSGFWDWKGLKDVIRKIAERDGILVPIVFEQEPASGGKNQVAALKEYLNEVLPGYKVYGLEAKKVGDRVMAANIWFGEAANGQFYYVKGLWNDGFFSQLDRFNGLFHDDRITSVTGGRHWIAPIRKWSKGGVVSV